MGTPLRILILEDNLLDTELMLRELRRAGFEDPDWRRVDSEKDYLEHLHADLDIILSDFQMPHFNGLRALELLRDRGLDIPFILISGTMGEDIAVEAMKQGASDYLLKDRLARLGSAIEHAMAESRLRRERKTAWEALQLRESALNEVSQGVLICDENRLITYTNASFSRITGYSCEEILGRHCSILQGAGTSPETILKIRSALNDGKPFEGEILNYRKDGQPFWNDLSISPIRGKNGRPLRFIGIQRDITERKQAEEHLAANEALLREFIQHTPAAIAMLDMEMRYIQVSERWMQDYHLADQSIIGKNHYEIFPESPQRWRDIHQRVLAGAIERCEEDPFPRADGTTDWLQWEARPWCKAGGEIGGLIFFTQVITERKQAHIALLESQHFAESIAENSTSVIYVSDFKTRRNIYTNRNAAEALGYSQAQILELGEDFLPKLMHPDDHRRVLQDDVQLAEARDGRIFDHEVRLKHAEGGWRWFWTREAVFNRHPDGTPRHIMGTAQDITERKEAQQALGVALERLQVAVKAGKAGVWNLDLLTGDVDWDEQMLTLYGKHVGNVEPGTERWYRAIHPDDIAHVSRTHNEALQGESDSFDMEFRIFRGDDGSLRFIRAMGVVLRDESGAAVRMTGINFDITEQHNREEKLAAALAQEKELSEKARAGDRAKSEFLAVMSHEVRTPMNGIIGFAELLLQAPLSPEYHNYARTIVQSGEALAHVLDDILDFSRLEAGGLKVADEVFSPRLLLEDIRRLMAHQASEKNVEVLLAVADSIPGHLHGDAGRIRQILFNIVGNAVKFTQNGTISITLKPLVDQPSSFVFSVQDTGVGITTEQIGRIFQPFTQADSSISRKYGGTGLGLTISRRLAELLGGELTVKSEPGRGSEFFIVLPLGIADKPLEAPSEEGSEKLDANFATRHPMRLLVAEDDRVNLKLILTLLRRLGYAPLSAANGLEAVEVFQQKNPDCLLMDLQMPEMDGIKTTSTIRALEKSTNRAPIFISALTANIFPADRQRCLEAGMNAYLNKPVKIAALADMLSKAFDFRS